MTINWDYFIFVGKLVKGGNLNALQKISKLVMIPPPPPRNFKWENKWHVYLKNKELELMTSLIVPSTYMYFKDQK